MEYVCFSAFEFLDFMPGLFNDTKALPHFLATNKPAVIVIAGGTDRNIELQVFITGIRRMYANIIINSRRPQIRSRKSIVQCSFSTDGPGTLGTVHKDPVTLEKIFKFFQHAGIFFEEFFQ